MPVQPPILIIGAGIVGLTLAQALKKRCIPFLIFERSSPASIQNQQGWGLTIHWALPHFQYCLPPDIFKGLNEIQVDLEQARNDTGRFLFLDLKTAEPKYVIPPSKRLRIHRGRLRDLLSEGIEIQWGKNLMSITRTKDAVVAHFEDGTTIEGALLVGADGSSSRTRQALFSRSENPEAGRLYQLPVRFMGVTLRLSKEKAWVLREIDPLLFQGSHPDSGVYLWYSTLSTPERNGSARGGEEGYYEAQLMMSWLKKGPKDEVPPTSRERVAKMKEMAHDFEARLRNAIMDIHDDAEVLEIKLQDWTPQKWDNLEGKVTLVGDAAHAMTMYRGEAFNHGIMDAARLSERIAEAHEGGYDAAKLHEAVKEYEDEMRERTHSAVLLSRQACLDAHDIKNLGPNSPLVSKRARILIARL
jgi:2-polyprenyl-6-methoxyphenol hydroxylase-like FAD-dependent oxidoreductase